MESQHVEVSEGNVKDVRDRLFSVVPSGIEHLTAKITNSLVTQSFTVTSDFLSYSLMPILSPSPKMHKTPLLQTNALIITFYFLTQ